MGVDRGYGTGTARSASNSASRRNAARAANNRRRTIRAAGRRIGNTATAALKPLAGSSEYIVRENAARAQLGVSGQAARYRQLPRAARATARGLVREITGVDVSRNGIKADPFSVAMAWGPGKIAKVVGIAKRAREVGRLGETAYEALMDRARAGEVGRAISRFMRQNGVSSVPNNASTAGRGAREGFRAVADSEAAMFEARWLQSRGMDPGQLYPSGVPRGGWVREPNLRTRRPVTPQYTFGSTTRTVQQGVSESTRSTIEELLDEATVARNLSSSTKFGGRTYFPRTYRPDDLSRPAPGTFDPAVYRKSIYDLWLETAGKQRRLGPKIK